ncbi:unnamed protein product, partial [Musa textilis]
SRYAVSSCTARYGRYVPVRQDTGTRTALYRAVRLVSPVSVDTEIYRAVTVEISTVTARHSSVTVDFDRYRPAQLGNGRFRQDTGTRTALYQSVLFFIFLLINKYFLMLGDVTEARVTSPRLWR